MRDDPWGDAEVLNDLFWTADPKVQQDVEKLQKGLDLDDATMAKLKELGFRERRDVQNISGNSCAKRSAFRMHRRQMGARKRRDSTQL